MPRRDFAELAEMYPNYLRDAASRGVPAANEILEDYQQWLNRTKGYCPEHGWDQCNCPQVNLREENTDGKT